MLRGTEHAPQLSIFGTSAQVASSVSSALGDYCLLHTLNVMHSELHQPTMVTVAKWQRMRRSVVFGRGLVCGQSSYFASAFSERFGEGHGTRTRLPGVKQWSL